MMLRVARRKSESRVVIATVHREGTSSVALSAQVPLAMKQGSAVLYPSHGKGKGLLTVSWR